jgi:hypothetical protein
MPRSMHYVVHGTSDLLVVQGMHEDVYYSIATLLRKLATQTTHNIAMYETEKIVNSS